MASDKKLLQAEEEARAMAYARFLRNMKGVRLTLQDKDGQTFQSRHGSVEEARQYAERQLASGKGSTVLLERYDRGNWLSV